MDARTIHTLLRYVRNFAGVYARNTLPQYMRTNCGLIVNTDPLHMRGQHWVAIFRDNDGYCEYFDPYGIPPLHNEFMDFLSNNSTVGVRWSQRPEISSFNALSASLAATIALNILNLDVVGFLYLIYNIHLH